MFKAGFHSRGNTKDATGNDPKSSQPYRLQHAGPS